MNIKSWTVLVEGTTTPPMSGSQVVQLLEELDGYPSAISNPNGEIEILTNATAENAADAAEEGERRVQEIITSITGAPMKVVNTYAAVAAREF